MRREKTTIASSAIISSTSQPAVIHALLCIFRLSFRHHEGNRAFAGRSAPTTSSTSWRLIVRRFTVRGCPAKNAASRMYLSERRLPMSPDPTIDEA